MCGDGDSVFTTGISEAPTTWHPGAEHALMPVVVTAGNGWDFRRLRRCLTQENGFLLIEGHPPAEQLLAQCQRMAPCVLIADEQMICGIEPARFAGLVDFGRSVKVLAFGHDRDERVAAHLLRMGCMGLIASDVPAPVLKKAVRAVGRGEIWAGRKLITRVFQQLLFATRSPRLTPREREILQWIAKGANNRSIAERLCISHETVRWHIRSLHAKLGLQDRSGTALFARHYLEGDAQEDTGGG
jgi:DNA-binding NarL/FixJ family response regulator